MNICHIWPLVLIGNQGFGVWVSLMVLKGGTYAAGHRITQEGIFDRRDITYVSYYLSAIPSGELGAQNRPA